MLHATVSGQANAAEYGKNLELTVSSSRAFAPDLRVGRPSADLRGVMHGKPIEQGTTQPRVEEFGQLEDLTRNLALVLGELNCAFAVQERVDDAMKICTSVEFSKTLASVHEMFEKMDCGAF